MVALFGDFCQGRVEHATRFATHTRGLRKVCEQCAYEYDIACEAA